MNVHFLFFLLDIVAWLGIALFLSYASLVQSYHVNLHYITKLYTVIITICAGFFSVLIHGLPDTGFSTNSFIYAFFVAFSFVYYQQTRKKQVRIKKILTKM